MTWRLSAGMRMRAWGRGFGSSVTSNTCVCHDPSTVIRGVFVAVRGGDAKHPYTPTVPCTPTYPHTHAPIHPYADTNKQPCTHTCHAPNMLTHAPIHPYTQTIIHPHNHPACILYALAGDRVLSHAHRQRPDHQVAVGRIVGQPLPSGGQAEDVLKKTLFDRSD